MENEIKKAIEILNRGGVIIFPTDTTFGIGCRIDREDAVEKLYRIKKRPSSQSSPVLVDTVKMARELADVSQEIIDKLIEPYWPGALTIVMKCKIDKIPILVRGGGNTIGLRIPADQTARSVIRGIGVGLIASSANFSGCPTPFRMEDLDREIVKLVDYVIPGETKFKKASTVIDCSKKPWKILRQGAIEISNIKSKMSETNEKKKVTLIIDTSSNKQIKAGIRIEGKENVIVRELDSKKAQIVLPMIEEVLKKNKLSLEDLSLIEVNEGPGSFTGLRVGVSVANALGFALKIPINGKKLGDYVTVKY